MPRRFSTCSTITPAIRWAAGGTADCGALTWPVACGILARLPRCASLRCGGAGRPDQLFHRLFHLCGAPCSTCTTLSCATAGAGGVGQALLTWAELRARELGCCKLTLERLSNNDRAMASYRRRVQTYACSTRRPVTPCCCKNLRGALMSERSLHNARSDLMGFVLRWCN